MKISFVLYSLFLISTSTFGDVSNCLGVTEKKVGSLEKVITSCAVQEELAKDPLVKENHKKLVYEKLAKKLAIQMKQNSEELALLTNFFSMNGKDLTMNSPEVHSQCRLESIKKIENCDKGQNNSLQREKLNYLKKNFLSNNNTPLDDQTLYGMVAAKYLSDLGLKGINKQLQCPLENTSGIFSLQGQLDDISAENILLKINNEKSANQPELYNEYAQLKIIKDSNDPAFIRDFQNEMKNKPANITAKEHISSFFFKEKNQKVLAKTLAAQCTKMTDNLNTFLCSDLDELGSLDNKASIGLFNELKANELLEKQYQVDLDEPGILTAYGMQCLAKKKLANKSNQKDQANKQNIDQWFNDFTDKTRPEVSSESASTDQAQKFCSLYNCEDPSIKNTSSCQKGGPLLSNDLSNIFRCQALPSRGEKCSSQILKTVDLLSSIENLKNNAKTKANNKSENGENKNSEKKEGVLPSFVENYLGAEGTLKALGKEVTPISIAEKKQDIEERKVVIAPSPTSTSPAPVTTTASRPMTVTNSESQASQETSNQIQNPEYKPTASVSGNSGVKSAVSGKTEIKTTTAANKIQNANSDSNPESSRLRSEMEKMLQDMKANGADGAINQNSPTVAGAAKTKSNNATVSNDSTSAEEDRLKRWEQNLNDKSRNLDQYRRELDNRAYADRSVSQEDTSGKSATSAKTNNSLGVNDSSGGASGSNGSSATLSATKLAPAGQKGEQKNNTAAIIQSGKESSTLSVDELAQLSPDNLKILGIDSSKPFTLRVNFNAKTYEVPVKSLLYKGNNILGPVIDPKNKDLKEFLLKSPLFKPYHDYRMERGSLIDI